MNVKGGIAYIDCKRADLTTAGTYNVKNIFRTIKKAFESKKIVILHNICAIEGFLCDVSPSSVRKRDDSHYTFYITFSNRANSGFNSRYCIVSSDDTIEVSVQ